MDNLPDQADCQKYNYFVCHKLDFDKLSELAKSTWLMRFNDVEEECKLDAFINSRGVY